MRFVTLTSDWDKDDYYTGAVKGTILASCGDVSVVTLSNRVKPFSIAEAAIVVRNSSSHFPKGTIHLIAVGTDPEPGCDMLLAEIDDHFYITADNGILGLLGDAEKSEVVKLAPPDSPGHASFPALTIFTEAACSVLNGSKPTDLGKKTDTFKKQIPLRATLEHHTITGTVIYIDSYGNAITNISRELFDRIGKEQTFSIYVQSKHYRITKLNQVYSETPAGDLLALFNSVNLLEIAIRNGSAKDLLNLNTDSTIRVEFNQK